MVAIGGGASQTVGFFDQIGIAPGFLGRHRRRGGDVRRLLVFIGRV
jgi:hypothetical protein